jgi:carbamoyl-phosphate synthase small subunit
MKQNMLRSLRARGCERDAFPAYTKAEEIIGGGFDGVILSNGPGDPADCMDIAGEIRKMCDAGLRIFGVCFGHQLVALGMGAKTGKLRYGHRGGNHPVKDLERGRGYITSQNHGYVVKAETLDPSVGTVQPYQRQRRDVEGVRYKNGRVFTVQFHPEASPGPNDTGYLFDKFVDLMGGEAHA